MSSFYFSTVHEYIDTMITIYIIFTIFLSLIHHLSGLNVLFISIGRAGHVIPLFELAKAMHNHNVTFLTQRLATNYINFDLHSLPSTFRIIYANDSFDGLLAEKQLEDDLNRELSSQSSEARSRILVLMGQTLTGILNKSIHTLTEERFDVIVVSMFAIAGKTFTLLCEKAQTPCVAINPAPFMESLDFNLPNTFSLLHRTDMYNIKHRLYNAIFNIRLIIGFIYRLPVLSKMIEFFPNVPGPFQDSFTVKNILNSQPKYLELICIPPTFYIPTYPNHYKKYLGVFIDETTMFLENNELKNWIQSKVENSVIYATFGSTSIIPSYRMRNLIIGLAMFLSQEPDSSVILTFRRDNLATFQAVLKTLDNREFIGILNNAERVRIEGGFVEQKWILSQKSIKLFISHCGMNSVMEALYLKKPILCMPFSADQFNNAIIIDDKNLGLSLFTTMPLSKLLISPYSYTEYTFTAATVEQKLLNLWTNKTFEDEVRKMSLEMKHSGGIRRAIEEIEFYVELNGDLDRYAPFHTTLPFYQRYLLDLIFILVVLPSMIFIYLINICRRKQRKIKAD